MRMARSVPRTLHWSNPKWARRCRLKSAARQPAHGGKASTAELPGESIAAGPATHAKDVGGLDFGIELDVIAAGHNPRAFVSPAARGGPPASNPEIFRGHCSPGQPLVSRSI